MAGRPKHAIWELFDVEKPRGEGKRHPDMKCRGCEFVVVNAQATRNALKHVLSCSSISDAMKKQWITLDAELRRKKRERLVTPSSKKKQKRQRNTPVSITRRLAFDSSTQTPVSRPDTPIRPGTRTKEERHLAIARAFYACGISFRAAQSPEFKGMFEHDDIPSPYQIGGPLLDKIYRMEHEEVVAYLRTQEYVTIVTDGWSNPRNESIINFVVVNPNIRPLFWKSIATGEATHTAEYIANLIGSVIEEAESCAKPLVVVSVVTDNTANMKGAWRILERDRLGLICNGCASHTMNLLIKDIFEIEFFSRVLKQATTLSRFVNLRHALRDRFRTVQTLTTPKSKRRRALSLPVPTRWYSGEACIRSVVANKNVICAAFADESLMSRYKERGGKLQVAKNIMTDTSFWADAEIVLKIVGPINLALSHFEQNNCCISMIQHHFENLMKMKEYNEPIFGLDIADQKDILKFIKHRQEFLFTPSMRIAFFLDHSKKQVCSTDIIPAAVALAKKIGLVNETTEDVLHRELKEFGLMRERWSAGEQVQQAKFDPLEWWTLASKTKFSMARKLALRVFSVPTSSAASERSWSIHSFIHSKLRNRLSNDRAEKLVFVYTNMGDKNAVDQLLFQLFPDVDDADPAVEEEEFDDIVPLALTPRELVSSAVCATRSRDDC